MPVFHHQFSRAGKYRYTAKKIGAVYLGAMFLTPTVMMYLICNDYSLNWFVKEYKPMVFPPQSDPKIITDIYYGRNNSEQNAPKGKVTEL